MKAALFSLAFFALTAAAQAQTHSKIETAPPEDPAPPSAPRKLPDKLPAAAVPEPPNRSPDEVVATFFDALKADRVDAAYDTLNAEFAMVDRGGAAKSMREQTQKALDAYGPVIGYELVREENLGTHLVRRTSVLVGDVLPLRWKFYFYKPAERWKLIDLRIDDAIAEWFDNAPSTKQP